MAEGEPEVYDVRKVDLVVAGHVMTGIGEDGFGISPSQENTLIKGLKGEAGFNMDTSTAGEATVSLLSTSSDNETLRALLATQTEVAEGQKPVPFEMRAEVTSGYEDAFGYSAKGLRYCMIVGPPELVTEKEAPQYEWKIVGYGYYEEPQ